jgi:hypothetical protein
LTARASTIIMEGLGKNAYIMAIKSQLLWLLNRGK